MEAEDGAAHDEGADADHRPAETADEALDLVGLEPLAEAAHDDLDEEGEPAENADPDAEREGDRAARARFDERCSVKPGDDGGPRREQRGIGECAEEAA